MDFKQDFEWIDMTHRLTPTIPTWSGKCGFSHQTELNYSDCTGDTRFKVQKLEMVGGIGTHIDAPSHCFENGIHVADIPISRLIESCVVIDVSARCNAEYLVSVEDIVRFEKKYGTIQSEQIVLIYTGWERFWDDPEKYRNDHRLPGLSEEGAVFLSDRKVSGVGIDTLSIDQPLKNYPAHRILLGAGIFVIENVAGMAKMPPRGGYLICLPIKGEGLTESPVRLVGMRRK